MSAIAGEGMKCMAEPVDLANLHSMTDGDAEMEKALFSEFFNSFEKGISVLHQGSAGDSEVWRKQAHALKGIALNLGAYQLGALCKQAQEEYQSHADKKSALTNDIEAEYAQVKDFLAGL